MTKNIPITAIDDVTAASVPDTASSRVYGVIDLLRENRIAGWAIDRAEAAAAVTVDIYRDGRLICSVTADRHRPDLEKGGIGTGKYGFRAEIDPPLDAGFEFTISALARAADGASVGLKPTGSASPDVSTETLLLQRLYGSVQQALLRLSEPLDDIAALSLLIERLELTQARIESSIIATTNRNPEVSESGFTKIVYGTLAIGLLSLGIGMLSLFF